MEQKIPAIIPVKSPRLNIDTETAAFLEHLDVHGYAVVASIASPTEVEHVKNLLWKFIEDNTECLRDDSSTWEVKHG